MGTKLVIRWCDKSTKSERGGEPGYFVHEAGGRKHMSCCPTNKHYCFLHQGNIGSCSKRNTSPWSRIGHMFHLNRNTYVSVRKYACLFSTRSDVLMFNKKHVVVRRENMSWCTATNRVFVFSRNASCICSTTGKSMAHQFGR